MHRAQAEQKAREAFVMTLLRFGDISAGRAARILGINRSQLSEVMYEHKVSPFDSSMTREELEQEANAVLRSLPKGARDGKSEAE